MVTLSLVITSWGGTFMATVWMVTVRIRSIPNGSRMIRPGPLARPRTRPSRNTTPRSYSWSTWTMETIPQTIRAITATTIRTTTQELMGVPPVQVVRFRNAVASLSHPVADRALLAQIGDRALGEAARAPGEQAPERVRGQEERRVAEVAEERHLEQRKEDDVL